MTLNALNSSVIASKQFNAQITTLKFDGVEDDVASENTAPVVANQSDNFVKNVLQSLQNLGVAGVDANADSIDVSNLSENANVALQTFMQSLYEALTPDNSRQTSPISNDNSLDVNDTVFSGGSNFRYNVDLSEAELGDYLPSVRANLQSALDNIGQYVDSKIPFDLKVFTKNIDDSTLAEANSTIITTTQNDKVSIDTSFVSDSMYGVELQPGLPDSKIYINLARLEEMSFTGLPDPEKFDFTSVITHEILHGLAFTGALDTASPLRTGFDDLVAMDNDVPVFLGRHARTTNAGNPIPLAPETLGAGSSFYHVAAPSDLMSASIKKGEVKTISPLDVAMLQDMGIGTTITSPNLAKIQNAYGNTSAGLQNLLGSIKQNEALQTDFDNLVQSLDGATSAANLQDFLIQLSQTIQNGNSLQNGLNAFISVSV